MDKKIIVLSFPSLIDIESSLLFAFYRRGRLDSEKATHDHHSQAAGDTKERLQQLAQTGTPCPRAAVLRDRP